MKSTADRVGEVFEFLGKRFPAGEVESVKRELRERFPGDALTGVGHLGLRLTRHDERETERRQAVRALAFCIGIRDSLRPNGIQDVARSKERLRREELLQELNAVMANIKPPVVRGAGKIALVNPLDHPTYDPGLWNQDGIRKSTNCYAYACNDPFGHVAGRKPQPGQMDGFTLGEPEPAHGLVAVGSGATINDKKNPNIPLPPWEVRYAVKLDSSCNFKGLIPIIREPGEPVVNQVGYYLVALAVDPRLDYHWYRQDRSGYWSHKPGHDPVTNVDGRGAPITDPETCDMTSGSIRYRFDRYFYCPKGGMRTGTSGNNRR